MRIKTFIITTAAAFALAACGSSDTAGPPKGEPIAKVASPAGKAWIDVVSKTEFGGYQMGNPSANLKLLGQIIHSHDAQPHFCFVCS